MTKRPKFRIMFCKKWPTTTNQWPATTSHFIRTILRKPSTIYETLLVNDFHTEKKISYFSFGNTFCGSSHRLRRRSGLPQCPDKNTKEESYSMILLFLQIYEAFLIKATPPNFM